MASFDPLPPPWPVALAPRLLLVVLLLFLVLPWRPQPCHHLARLSSTLTAAC